MKRLMVVVCLLSVLSPAVDSERVRAASSHAPAAPDARRKLNITVDPRIELLSIVQSLGIYFLINKDDTPYRRGVESYFGPFKNHPAVQMFNEMWPKGFNFDVPPNVMLYLSDPPQLKQRRPFAAEILKRAGGAERLNQFVSRLRDFARDTKFMDFYRANRKTYERLVEGVRLKAQAIDYVGVLESYYRIRQHSYNIMLMPLAHELGFGLRLERPDGTLDVYQMIGRSSVKDGLPVFGEGGDFTLQHLVWHEFSHSFINPPTEKHRQAVMKYASLYDPISKQMKE